MEGINLIDASAGTGKTYTIEGIYLRLVVEQGIPVEKILGVTFTEAATSELKDRILKRLRQSRGIFSSQSNHHRSLDEPLLQSLRTRYFKQSADCIHTVTQRLRHAIDTFDDSAILTIHGFCRRTLADFAFESNTAFDTEIVTTVDPYIREISEDYWRTLFYNRRVTGTVLLRNEFPTPDNFLKLFQSAYQCPNIKTVPSCEHVDVEKELSNIDALFDELFRLWNESKGTIESMLSKSRALNKKVYPEGSLPGRISALENLFSEYQFDLSRIKWFFQSKIDASVKKNEIPPQVPFFKKIEYFAQQFSKLQSTIKSHFLYFSRLQLKKRLEKLHLQSFNGLLTDLYATLGEKKGALFEANIAKTYQAALIDEFQDTDAIQFQIFYRLFALNRIPVFFIGDPKQSIYRFRGGDIYTYGKAKRIVKQADNGHSYTLHTNYRSDRRLIQAINTVFHYSENPFLSPDIEYFDSNNAAEGPGIMQHGKPVSPFWLWFSKQPKDGPIGITAAEKTIIASCCSEIVRLLDPEKNFTIGREPIRPQDICVLVKTHKQAAGIQQALSFRNVPCVLQTRQNIFDSQEFRELAILLRGIIYFKSVLFVKQSLVTNIFGCTGDEIASLSKNEIEWELIVHNLHRYQTIWQRKGVYPMLSALFKERKVRERVLNSEFGERKLTNLLHSVELFHAAEKENAFGLTGLLAWAQHHIETEEMSEEGEIRLETDDNALHIMTIHAGKGLEFPIVFCPFSWKPNPPHETIFHKQDGVYYDLGSPSLQANREISAKEALAENIRLLYVALTRAKHMVHLFWGEFKNTENSPIVHVFHEGSRKNLWSDLVILSQKSEGNIRLSEMSADSAEKYHHRQSRRRTLQCRSYTKSRHSVWTLSSYSSLAKKMIPDTGEKDHDGMMYTPTAKRKREPLSIFQLPRGSNTGVCLHEIFEDLDFTEKDHERMKTLVSQKLKRYAIDAIWEPIVTHLVINVLNLHLGSGIRLNRISTENRRSEMEFFFPLENGNIKRFLKRLIEAASGPDEQSVAESIGRMNIDRLSGIMRGFIDLIFRWNDRYYILDWKTNHLGDQLEDYHKANLDRYMIRQAYCLQYYIYTLALHKYLQNRVIGYQYETHIGGVFYLFVRGIATNRDSGVYYKAMQQHGEFMRLLDSYFFLNDQN